MELRDRISDDRPDNFFRDFPRRLGYDPVTSNFYRGVELALGFVPSVSWPGYVDKVGTAALYRDRKRERHWEKLHDVFNEAFGAQYLVEQCGCTSVEIIVPSLGIAPDWRGVAKTRIHYLEVKTINHSDVERMSWFDKGTPLSHTVKLPAQLIRKTTEAYLEAVAQVNAPADADSAIKAVFFVINPDHNVDPCDRPVDELFKELFSTIEVPGVSIAYLINET
jgi:hypothetical protein